MTKETTFSPGAVEQEGANNEQESRLAAIISRVLARLDMSKSAKFKRGILQRNFSRQVWVDLAITHINQAVERGTLNEAERDSLIEAVQEKAAVQQEEKYR